MGPENATLATRMGSETTQGHDHGQEARRRTGGGTREQEEKRHQEAEERHWAAIEAAIQHGDFEQEGWQDEAWTNNSEGVLLSNVTVNRPKTQGMNEGEESAYSEGEGTAGGPGPVQKEWARLATVWLLEQGQAKERYRAQPRCSTAEGWLPDKEDNSKEAATERVVKLAEAEQRACSQQASSYDSIRKEAENEKTAGKVGYNSDSVRGAAADLPIPSVLEY
jgi:hypothetical protein